jgi:hypothetical protein
VGIVGARRSVDLLSSANNIRVVEYSLRGSIGFGLSFTFRKTFALTPSMSYEFGDNYDEPTFGLAATVGLGKR